MDDHFLAQGGGDDVVAAGEGFEHSLGHKLPEGLEQQLFAHQ